MIPLFRLLVTIHNIILSSCSVIICISLNDKTADNNDNTHDDNLERKVDCRFRFMSS